MRATNTMSAKPAQFDRSRQDRRSMEAKIHVALKQLDMEEDAYRQGMFNATGKISLKKCSDAEVAKVLDWLKSKGFKPMPGRGKADHPMARKARALWVSLYHLGAINNSSEQALEAFAKRQLRCEKLQWAKQADAFRLIEALKSMAVRAGWLQHCRVTGKHLTPIVLQSSLCHLILARLKDAGVAPADWGLHDAGWKLCGIPNAKDTGWTAEDYDRLAAALGKKLRKYGSTIEGGRAA